MKKYFYLYGLFCLVLGSAMLVSTINIAAFQLGAMILLMLGGIFMGIQLADL